MDDVRFDDVRTAIDELRDMAALARLHARDASVWSEDPDVQASIAQRLGWLDAATVPAGGRADVQARLDGFAAEVAADGIDRVVLAGMGGSSLAPEVFATLWAGAPGGLAVSVLDSTHPAAVAAALDDADLTRTLVIASSKSGTTEETRAFALHAQRLVPSPAHLAAITDPDSELAVTAAAGGWRATFINPADIGGRYSALSLFGMVPARLAGVDTATIWQRAAAMLDRCGPDVDPADAPGAVLGAYMAGLARAGRDKLTLVGNAALAPLGDWIEQLVAESTGKQGVGIIPVVGEPVSVPASYGQDRAFVELRLGGEGVPSVAALADAGHPVLTLELNDRDDLGAEFVRWQVATALAGALLGVNPFDEPNVAESKANTMAVLDEVAAGGALAQVERGDLVALIATLTAGDYVSVQAYLPATPDRVAALQRLRATIRDRYRVATTLGFGPRFLHSTGQLHKGGPDTVVAVQLVDEPAAGPDIQGRPYDFATLVRAQAVGDLRSLRAHDRRVVQLAATTAAEIDALTATVGRG